MYSTCPKCAYERQPGDAGDPGQCPACGIFFSKWMKQRYSRQPVVKAETGRRQWDALAAMAALLVVVEERVNPFHFWGRTAAYTLFLVWGWHFIRMDFTVNPYAVAGSFMHTINLVFHEAGHVLFRPCGWFMTILGGTLGQLLMPAVITAVFLFRYHNAFAASIGLWWLGQSCIDCAPYVDDALEQKLVLLGGRTGADAPGNHDWNNILGDLNMLEKHRDLAQVFDGAGACLILLALAWGGLILYRQFRNLESMG